MHGRSRWPQRLPWLGGCFSTPPSAPRPAPRGGLAAGAVPPPPQPRPFPTRSRAYEPRSRYGNPPFYDVFGKRYYVLSSSAATVERGVASWYGPGFHKVRTSTREPYDMYGMTAAHKTLPLPSYVRVTNLQNGRSIVVRVNDRGPFVGNRIIDLSYTAAAKLDMLRNGTAMVEVRTIDPTAPPARSRRRRVGRAAAASPPPASAAQARAARSVARAADACRRRWPPVPVRPAPATSAPVRRAVRPGRRVRRSRQRRTPGARNCAAAAMGKVFVRDDVIAGRRMYRVRIGPVPTCRSSIASSPRWSGPASAMRIWRSTEPRVRLTHFIRSTTTSKVSRSYASCSVRCALLLVLCCC